MRNLQKKIVKSYSNPSKLQEAILLTRNYLGERRKQATAYRLHR